MMFRSVLLALALAGACAAQPPARLDRPLAPVPGFDGDEARRQLIEIDNRMIPLLEDWVKSNEDAIRTFRYLTPEQLKEMKERLAKMRALLAEAKKRRQELLEEEAKANPVPARVPVAPMPRAKARFD